MLELSKAEVAPLLSDALAQVEQTLALYKTASDENQKLQTRIKALEAKEIHLTKVASTRIFSDEDIQAAGESLVEAGYLPSAQIAKFASDLKANPSGALTVLGIIAKDSAKPQLTGRGVPKTANAAETEPKEDWSVLIRHN